MTMKRWNPLQECTPQETFLLSRLHRHRKLFAFLREQRHVIFDDAFQAEMEIMYRRAGPGRDPVPPALLCMALLLQSYTGASDAEVVELTVMDLRWQLVLGCLGADKPAFAQGSLVNMRQRLIDHDMDRRLLERTREIAGATGAFDSKKLPTNLRMAVDSSPLEGAGRVEDTFNLLAHAGRKIAAAAAVVLNAEFGGWTKERVCEEAAAPLLLASSPKAGLDINWSDGEEKSDAMLRLMDQLVMLNEWVAERLPGQVDQHELGAAVQTFHQVVQQDLEPANEDGSGVRVREGVAKDRRISIEDAEMRHGRKSKSKRFDGYKRHLAIDLDFGLIIAAAVTPANWPEDTATPALEQDIARLGVKITEASVDRGYINSTLVGGVLQGRGKVLCKPWSPTNGSLFAKTDFAFDMRSRTITCPAGQTQKFDLGSTVKFDADLCSVCPLRAMCTTGAGPRTVHIGKDERLQKRLRDKLATKSGRAALRERVKVEHTLAHLSRKQKRRARYLGARKNLLDVRRAAAVINLETIHRALTRGAAKAA